MVTVYLTVKSFKNLAAHMKEQKESLGNTDLGPKPDMKIELTDLPVSGRFVNRGDEWEYSKRMRTCPEREDYANTVTVPSKLLIGNNLSDIMKGTVEIPGIDPGKKGMVMRMLIAFSAVLYPYIYEEMQKLPEKAENCGILISNEEFPSAKIVSGKDRPELAYMKFNFTTGKMEQATGRVYSDEAQNEVPEDAEPDVLGAVTGISRVTKDPKTGEEKSVPLTPAEYRSIYLKRKLNEIGTELAEKFSIRVSEDKIIPGATFGRETEVEDFLHIFMGADILGDFCKSDGIPQVKTGTLPKLTVLEMTDVPYTAVVRVVATHIELSVYNRRFIKMLSDQLSEVTYDISGGECVPAHGAISIKSDGITTGATVAFMFAYMKTMEALEAVAFRKRHVLKGNDGSGVLVKLSNGEPVLQFSRYTMRPRLLCIFPDGEEKVYMPYPDLADKEVQELLKEKWLNPDLLKAAAENGDADCAEALAELDSGTTPEEKDRIAYRTERSASLGGKEAQFNAGMTFLEGRRVERNLQKASAWLKKASDSGTEDISALVKETEKAAENERKSNSGDMYAAAHLAEFLSGRPDQASQRDGFALAESSAQSGNPAGLFALARCYADGIGTEKNEELAHALMEKAASGGDPSAVFRLGESLLGEHTEEQKKNGVIMITQAAENGCVPAMKRMGKLYETGIGVPEDPVLAAQWYEKALEKDPDDEDLEFDLFMLRMLLDNP